MKISVQELVIVLIIVILIFGPTQLPKLAKMFGKGVKGARKKMKDAGEAADDEDDDVVEEEPEKASKKSKNNDK